MRLRPKAFEMLRLFAANPGRVLSKLISGHGDSWQRIAFMARGWVRCGRAS